MESSASDSLAPLWNEDDYQVPTENGTLYRRTINQTTTVNPIQMPLNTQKIGHLNSFRSYFTKNNIFQKSAKK